MQTGKRAVVIFFCNFWGMGVPACRCRRDRLAPAGQSTRRTPAPPPGPFRESSMSCGRHPKRRSGRSSGSGACVAPARVGDFQSRLALGLGFGLGRACGGASCSEGIRGFAHTRRMRRPPPILLPVTETKYNAAPTFGRRCAPAIKKRKGKGTHHGELDICQKTIRGGETNANQIPPPVPNLLQTACPVLPAADHSRPMQVNHRVKQEGAKQKATHHGELDICQKTIRGGGIVRPLLWLARFWLGRRRCRPACLGASAGGIFAPRLVLCLPLRRELPCEIGVVLGC
jgi:hypothetical protein